MICRRRTSAKEISRLTMCSVGASREPGLSRNACFKGRCPLPHLRPAPRVKKSLAAAKPDGAGVERQNTNEDPARDYSVRQPRSGRPGFREVWRSRADGTWYVLCYKHFVQEKRLGHLAFWGTLQSRGDWTTVLFGRAYPGQQTKLTEGFPPQDANPTL